MFLALTVVALLIVVTVDTISKRRAFILSHPDWAAEQS